MSGIEPRLDRLAGFKRADVLAIERDLEPALSELKETWVPLARRVSTRVQGGAATAM
jgi:hypothetical protein